AMKSGTTSLHNYLKHHPDVFMSEPKELWYFVEEKNWFRGEKWYLSHFREAGGARVIGESSADYTMYPVYRGVPEKLHAFNPDARLVYLMRDPVQRAISHYWYDVRTGFEKRPITTAVYSETKYVDFSDYAMQLKLYFQVFKPEQIYIETFEQMVRHPEKVIREIQVWLGLDPTQYDWANLGRSYNATPDVVEQVKGWGFLHGLRYSGFWDFCHPLVPEFLLKIGRRLGYRKIDRKKATPGEVTGYLRKQLSPKIKELTKLLDRDFPEWNDMKSCKTGARECE
ncbi:MAG: sulfotransferase, partial [Desulfobacterales bacterium]|nr:sulfotransferase [Desulfobacterales bacterium]